VTFVADGVSDYEIAYQWVPRSPRTRGRAASDSVTAGQVQYRLYLDGTAVDEVVHFIADSPLPRLGRGDGVVVLVLGGWGTLPSAGEPHGHTVGGDKPAPTRSGASGGLRGRRGRLGWADLLGTERFLQRAGRRNSVRCVRAQVQPG